MLDTLKQREYLQDQSASFPRSESWVTPFTCLAAPAAGTSSPCQQAERGHWAGGMLSEVSDLQVEAGLQSWASLLHHFSLRSRPTRGTTKLAQDLTFWATCSFPADRLRTECSPFTGTGRSHTEVWEVESRGHDPALRHWLRLQVSPFLCECLAHCAFWDLKLFQF